MKKKGIIIGVAAAAFIVGSGVTAFGVNDLNAYAENANANVTAAPSPFASRQDVNTQGFDLSQITNLSSDSLTATVKDNVQEIRWDLEPYGYPALTVQKGIPVRLTITAGAENLNVCNNEILIPDLGIYRELTAGENIIEFTPTESGVIQYSCWMGMINSTVAVVDDINNFDATEVQKQIENLPLIGGCCGAIR